MTSDNSFLHTLILPPNFAPTIELERSIIPAHVPQTTFPSHLIQKIKANDMYCILQSIIIIKTFEHFLVESNKLLPDPLLYRFVKSIVLQENIQGS